MIDPDGDQIETIAWWDLADLPGNPAVRPELLADIEAVMAALTPPCCGRECCADGCCGGAAGCQCGPAPVADVAKSSPCACCGGTGEHPTGHECYRCDGGRNVDGATAAEPFCDEVYRDPAAHATGCPTCLHPAAHEVAKAGDTPKGGKAPAWPGWRLAAQAAAYWAPLVTAAVATVLTPERLEQVAAGYLTAHPDQDGAGPGKRDRNDTAAVWLAGLGIVLGVRQALEGVTPGILTDGYLIGAVSADAVVNGTGADLGGWQPGDTAAAQDRTADLGLKAMLAAALTASVAAAAAAIADGFLRALARVLAGADSGSDPASLAAGLGSAVADPGSPAIDDTLTEAAASAAGDVYAGHDVVWGQWAIDYGTKTGPCPLCLANEAAGPVPYGDPYPSGDTSAPIHPHCVIGSTRVTVAAASGVVTTDVAKRLAGDVAPATFIGGGDASLAATSAVAVAERDFGRGNIRAVTVRDYVGQVITIRTALGHELTATPNHPVATRRGWVPVAELAVGDHVLSSTGSEWEPAAVDPDVDDVPPRIKDVAESFPVMLGPVPTSAEDFHGDGSGSDVHVVRADGLLVDNGQPGGAKHSCEHQLGRGGVPVRGPLALNAERLAGQGFGRLDLPPDGVMGSGGEPGAIGRRGVSHPVDRGSLPATGFDAGVKQGPADGPSADAEGFCEGLLAHTSGIALDQIVYVRRHPFSDHVYNLDTVGGWYIGNGIVTHNCNCAVVPAEPPAEVRDGS